MIKEKDLRWGNKVRNSETTILSVDSFHSVGLHSIEQMKGRRSEEKKTNLLKVETKSFFSVSGVQFASELGTSGFHDQKINNKPLYQSIVCLSNALDIQ